MFGLISIYGCRRFVFQNTDRLNHIRIDIPLHLLAGYLFSIHKDQGLRLRTGISNRKQIHPASFHPIRYGYFRVRRYRFQPGYFKSFFFRSIFFHSIFQHLNLFFRHFSPYYLHEIIHFHGRDFIHLTRNLRTGKCSHSNGGQRKYIQVLQSCPWI